jgi:DNA-binding MarR family transcriptional regulator
MDNHFHLLLESFLETAGWREVREIGESQGLKTSALSMMLKRLAEKCEDKM